MNSQQVVWQFGKSHTKWFTWNEVKCPLLLEIWINNFSWKILERVFICRKHYKYKEGNESVQNKHVNEPPKKALIPY